MVTLWLALALYTAPNEGLPAGRAAFEKASRLFQKGAYERALPYFETAYRLSGRRPSTIYGLAQCERVLGHLDRAVMHLKEFIRVVPEDQAVRAHRALDAIRRERLRTAPRIEPRSRKQTATKSPPSVVPPPPPSEDAQTNAALTGAPEAAPEPSVGSFWTHPATWIVAGVVVIAGSVTAGWLLTRGGNLDGGTTGVVFEPLIRSP